MTCGRIKCYFEAKGYGYIEDFDGQEVYFHYTSVVGSAPMDIVLGATVYFEAIHTGIGLEANMVKVSGSIPA